MPGKLSSTSVLTPSNVESGAVHQPARGAALLLRSEAAPSPCSRRSQVASFQLPPWLEVGREKRGVDPDEMFASRQRHPDPLP